MENQPNMELNEGEVSGAYKVINAHTFFTCNLWKSILRKGKAKIGVNCVKFVYGIYFIQEHHADIYCKLAELFRILMFTR